LENTFSIGSSRVFIPGKYRIAPPRVNRAKVALPAARFTAPTLAFFHRIATLGEFHGSPAYAVRKAREVVEAHMRSFALARIMRLRIGRGTDSEGSPLFPHGENGMELELMVEGGMPERDVIVAATATNAEIPGISHNAGTLEAGKIAGVLRRSISL
jgi:imidazolonepropionase-like amidohydrolase